MQLESMRVTNFKCILDSGHVQLGARACLLGKNDSGKTALLEALYRLNPALGLEGRFDVATDYPRALVSDYQEEVEDGLRPHDLVIEAQFRLSKEEVHAVEERWGDGVLIEPLLTLSKGYDNVLYIDLPINEAVAVQALVRDFKPGDDWRARLGHCAMLDELAERIKAGRNDLPEAERYLERLTALAKKGLAVEVYDTCLETRVPQFLYFDEYGQLPGEANIDALQRRVEADELSMADRVLLGLLDLANLDLKQLLDSDRTEWLNNRLESAANRLTKRLLKYWTQNKHLRLRFDVRAARPGDPEGMRDGTNLWARVHDARRQITTSLGSRSRGFVWFVSLLALLKQLEQFDQPSVLLLDEPGQFLHPEAQRDLLDFIEKELEARSQVLYTAHSPFMVDVERLDAVLLVEDKGLSAEDDEEAANLGTQVCAIGGDLEQDNLLLLQAALGRDIVQAFGEVTGEKREALTPLLPESLRRRLDQLARV
jgi:ABC-type branched-subunit amino acid transport system ATPase component